MKAILLVVAFVLLGSWIVSSPARVRAGEDQARPPVLAYYYIWFEEESWDRGKSDFPAVGRYSSDDRAVMQQHVRWARESGLDGFIVSWKSTPKLDARLATLIDVAREANFKLAIIYQGLDFNRDPLVIERVQSDLKHFVSTWGSDPVFDLFGRPLVVWSGTWQFSTADVARVGATVRQSILLLASERSVEGIERLNGLVDGDAYYWSSVNPRTFPNYNERLVAMAHASQAGGGLWLAPAAPGFDARLVGGSSIVERNDGETMRIELQAAAASGADAVGVISWNEFSENSHVEPSVAYGRTYLDILRDFTDAPAIVPDIDSSDDPADTGEVFDGGRVGAMLLLAVVILAGLGRVLRRAP